MIFSRERAIVFRAHSMNFARVRLLPPSLASIGMPVCLLQKDPVTVHIVFAAGSSATRSKAHQLRSAAIIFSNLRVWLAIRFNSEQ